VGKTPLPLPLPKNCQLNAKEHGLNFEVEIEGRNWRAFITFEALDAVYPGRDRIHAVSQSSYIPRKVAECIRAGSDAEPISLTRAMFPF
jgi:hypothetical protein